MDPARAADMADPLCNFHFSRPWTGPPARKSQGRRPQAFSKGIGGREGTSVNTGEAAAQRAIGKAIARAARLDRTAVLLLALGYHPQAGRLAHRAAELRAVVE
jgi:hypothetical protein